jgi:tetratricopeptide (TPR) repeat protein
MLGRVAEARQILEGAIPLIEGGGDLATLSRALTNVGEVAKIGGDLAAARQHTERAVEVGERVGNPDRLAFDLANLADILLITGEWSGAAVALERGLALVGERRTAYNANVLQYLGRLALWTGEWDDAERRLEEARRLALEADARQTTEYGEVFLAELELVQGCPDAAVDRLRPLVEAEDANLGLLLPTFAWALVEAGKTEKAAEVARRAVERTRGQEPLNLVDALRVRGMVLTQQGQIEEAAGALREGLELARSLPHPYAEGRILYQLGLRAQLRGEPQQVREHLEEARAMFQRLGAAKDVERTEQVLSELALV